MPNSINPITVYVDAKQLQELTQATQKSKNPQRLRVDIYLEDAPKVVTAPQGPHEVNRGAWAYQPKHTSKAAPQAQQPPAPPADKDHDHVWHVSA